MNKIKNAGRALRRRHTHDVDDLPGPGWDRVDPGRVNEYCRMRVTVRVLPPGIHSDTTWYFVPSWAIELVAFVGTRGPMSHYGVTLLIALGVFIKAEGLHDALVAVHAAEPRLVVPFIVEQYSDRLPRLPKWLRPHTDAIRADLRHIREEVALNVEREAREGAVL